MPMLFEATLSIPFAMPTVTVAATRIFVISKDGAACSSTFTIGVLVLFFAACKHLFITLDIEVHMLNGTVIVHVNNG